jgi:hypothetical protein
MTKTLILGANGQLARNTTRTFLRDTDAKLKLYLRRASRLPNPEQRDRAARRGKEKHDVR